MRLRLRLWLRLGRCWRRGGTPSTARSRRWWVSRRRWDALDRTLPSCLKAGVLVAYNKQHRGPLLWLTAPRTKDGLALLAVAGIHGEPGERFAGGAFNARVNMCIGASSWALVLERLTRLCSTPAQRVWELADKAGAHGALQSSHFVA